MFFVVVGAGLVVVLGVLLLVVLVVVLLVVFVIFLVVLLVGKGILEYKFPLGCMSTYVVCVEVSF